MLRFSGLPFFFREIKQRNTVTILLYHDINKITAEKTFSYLSKRYNIIPLNVFVEAIKSRDMTKIPQYALIITFDDGHKENYSLLPLIKKYDVPVTIFLCSEIIGTNRHYWFSYENLLTEDCTKMDNEKRLARLETLGFEQTRNFSTRQALSFNEINEMKESVDFQSHSMFHPCFPKCTHNEVRKEIFDSKAKLEHELGLKIVSIAYPNGDYSEREIELSREAGYNCGITVDYGFNTVSTNPLKLKRLSMNDADNLDELIVRSSGVYAFLKNLFR